jgi:aminopeptidase
MSDSRYDSLARVLVGHSTKLKKFERVLIDVSETPEDFVIALIRATREAKADPFVVIHSNRVSRELARGMTATQASTMAEIDLARLKKIQAYIAVRGSHNIAEMADVPQEKSALLSSKLRPALDYRINKTRWVVLRWPTSSMAQQAQMSTEAFEDFFFQDDPGDEGAQGAHGPHRPRRDHGPRHGSALQHQGDRIGDLRRGAQHS